MPSPFSPRTDTGYGVGASVPPSHKASPFRVRYRDPRQIRRQYLANREQKVKENAEEVSQIQAGLQRLETDGLHSLSLNGGTSLELIHTDHVNFTFHGEDQWCRRIVLRLKDRRISQPFQLHFSKSNGDTDSVKLRSIHEDSRNKYGHGDLTSYNQLFEEIQDEGIAGTAFALANQTRTTRQAEQAGSQAAYTTTETNKVTKIWQIIFKKTKLSKDLKTLGTYFEFQANATNSLSKYHVRKRNKPEPMRRVMSENWYAEKKM